MDEHVLATGVGGNEAVPLTTLNHLTAPLIWDQAMRGAWLALLADAGVPLPSTNVSAWQLLLGFPAGDFGGWNPLLTKLELPGVNAELLIPLLLAPLCALALVALFLRGSRGASFALLTAVIGFATAVAASHLSLAASGDTAVAIWTGSGLSLYWMGLVGASIFALRALGRFAVAPAVVVALLVLILAAPLAAALPLGTSVVAKGIGRTQPAFVAAEADIDPQVGTLELSAQTNGGILGALVERLRCHAQQPVDLGQHRYQLRQARGRIRHARRRPRPPAVGSTARRGCTISASASCCRDAPRDRELAEVAH